jgi:hypothetical protein
MMNIGHILNSRLRLAVLLGCISSIYFSCKKHCAPSSSGPDYVMADSVQQSIFYTPGSLFRYKEYSSGEIMTLSCLSVDKKTNTYNRIDGDCLVETHVYDFMEVKFQDSKGSINYVMQYFGGNGNYYVPASMVYNFEGEKYMLNYGVPLKYDSLSLNGKTYHHVSALPLNGDGNEQKHFLVSEENGKKGLIIRMRPGDGKIWDLLP